MEQQVSKRRAAERKAFMDEWKLCDTVGERMKEEKARKREEEEEEARKKAHHPNEPQSWYDVEVGWRATGAAALRRCETTGEVKDRYLVAEAEQRAKAAHVRALGEKARRKH